MSGVFVIEAPARIGDRGELDALLREYYAYMMGRLHEEGGPKVDQDALMEGLWAGIGDYLPPEGQILQARDGTGGLVGCGFLRRIPGTETGEMKRLYVRPAARGGGLARELVTRRIATARAMGLKVLYADTLRGNTPMLTLYARLGFVEAERYPGNANPEELDEWLVYRKLEL